MNRTIVSKPGDGIGKTVLPEEIRILDAAGFEADYIHGDIGWEFWCKEGNALPQRTIDLLEEHKIGLFGAITSKPKAKPHCTVGNHWPSCSGYNSYAKHSINMITSKPKAKHHCTVGHPSSGLFRL